MMLPKLTVLMPVYNAGKFLAEAIDSILQQTFREFEFIIIDDGSNDNSVAIIQSYDDSRIRLYLNEANIGISATLNKGIGLAKTSLIARMDADDISYLNRLQVQYTYMLANPDCALVSSMVKVIGEDGHFIRQDKMRSEHVYYNLTFICWLYHPTVMYRKEAVQEVGLYTAAYSEDFELFWQLTRQYRFYNLPEVLLDYRVTDQSLHQVLKKEEYESAQQQQVLRNLRYYVGDHYTIPSSFIQCYRHNFAPLIAEQDLGQWLSCIRELDYITQCILKTQNPNLEVESVKLAARYKREFIIRVLIQHLPLHSQVWFRMRIEPVRSLVRSIKSVLKSKLRYRNALLPTKN
ncbi:glycosyltransferase [Pontibacter sp. HSC-14F20]|uniref:glycosyltransferase family 2 protein n=1 Tax=Pontibacter sp. HSC-14F20 TaxID=2864136 RepID=UPI001C72E368|nr:glycosyltransferase [Pontibacter sp. HSC-14F20]MBX0332352.1 glycosyltransferase [Pontibacter sp. HSC-14F20]